MPDDGKLHKDSVTGSHARALLQDEVLWKTRDDMTIHVGLGNGDKAQQYAQMMGIANAQKELLMDEVLWKTRGRQHARGPAEKAG